MRFTGSRPSSLNVGTFGKAATRWEDATTIGTRRFSLMNGRAEGRLSKTIGTWPATGSVRAGTTVRNMRHKGTRQALVQLHLQVADPAGSRRGIRVLARHLLDLGRE